MPRLTPLAKAGRRLTGASETPTLPADSRGGCNSPCVNNPKDRQTSFTHPPTADEETEAQEVPDITELQEWGQGVLALGTKSPLYPGSEEAHGERAGSCSCPLPIPWQVNSSQVSPWGEGPPPGNQTRPTAPDSQCLATICPIAFLNPAPSKRLRQAVETDKEAWVWAGWGWGWVFVLFCFVSAPAVQSLLPALHEAGYWGSGPPTGLLGWEGRRCEDPLSQDGG